MKNEWFLDVLNDLKSFAEANDLCAVAEKLEELGDLARAEMIANETGASDARCTHEVGTSGRLH